MNTVKRIIALILVSAVIVSSVMTEGLAAEISSLRQCTSEGGYLAIGDSNSRGFGSDGYYLGEAEDYDLRNVSGSFTWQIAKALGCIMPIKLNDKNGNYWPLAYPGQTVAVTKDLFGIDSSYQDEAYAFELYGEMMTRFGYSDSLTGVNGEKYKGSATVGGLDELAKRAEVITVELGINDVFSRPLIVAARNLGLGDMMHETIYIKDLSREKQLELATSMIKEMYNGFNDLKKYYPQMLEKLRKWNPSATIVVVGVYNIVSGMALTDDSPLPIGSALSAITSSMNKLFKSWAKDYGAIFVDVSNTSSYGTAQEWSIGGDFRTNVSRASHPDQEGHDYMARQVISVLPKTVEADEAPSTYIQVDLERIRKVTLVTVNGIPRFDYTLEGTNLTVPYTSTLGTLLSVIIVDSDGNVAVQKYTLTYEDGRYTALKTYGTSNLMKMLEKLIDSFLSIFNLDFLKI